MPVCYSDDPKAMVLGTLPDGHAGLVVKQHAGWTAIYSTAPKLPTPLLRRIAELGKVHFYADPGDVVWATHDLLAVCVHRPGPRTITLPRPVTVTDLYRGTRIGESLRSFQTDFDERATRVFVLK
jgi:hypothetical protein